MGQAVVPLGAGGSPGSWEGGGQVPGAPEWSWQPGTDWACGGLASGRLGALSDEAVTAVAEDAVLCGG